MTKQSDAHEAWVRDVASEIMKSPHKLIEYSIWETHCARRILALIAARLGDVTEEMVAALEAASDDGVESSVGAMIAASPLVSGDQT